MVNAKTVRALEKRLIRLESAVFGMGSEKPAKETSRAEGFSGPSGGVRLLVSKRFFKTQKSLANVREAFGKNGYHYATAVIQTALNRQSTRTAALATFKEGGKKMYVERK